MPPSNDRSPSTGGHQSTAEPPGDGPDRQFSRRSVLAAAGASGIAGVGLGAFAAAGFEVPFAAARDGCDPPLLSFPDDGWPMPGYDLANTSHVPAAVAPASLDSAWSVTRPRTRFASPVVANGTVLLPTVGERGDYRSRVRAVSLATGEERWRTTALCCGSTPHNVVVAGDLAFLRSEDGVTAVALADGSTVWRAMFESGAFASVPLVLDGQVFLRRRGEDSFTVHAMDGWTGDRCGETTVDVDVRNRPAVSPARCFFGTAEGVVALSREDWTVDWTQPLPRRSYVAPVYHDGMVYASGFAGYLHGLDAASGTVEWTVEFDHYVPGGRSGEEVYARPTPEFGAVTSDTLVVRENVYSDYASRVRAFDTDSGDRQWERTPPAPKDYYYATPVVAGDAVYTVELDHERDEYRLLELALDTGDQRAEVPLDVDGGAELVVADGRLVVVSETDIHAFGA